MAPGREVPGGGQYGGTRERELVEALTARVGRERLLRSRRRALLGSRRGRARESPLLATSVLSCE